MPTTESSVFGRYAFCPHAARLFPVLFLAAFPFNLLADQNWDGDNPVGNFSFNNNWFGNNQPGWGFGNGNLRFSFRNNGSQTSIFNDYTGSVDTNDILWDTTFGAGLTISGAGNGINFNQRIENNSSFTQTINIPLSGARNGAGQIELNPVNGNLILGGSIGNINNKPYFVFGNNGKSVTVNTTLGGDSSVAFTVSQNSTAILAAEQTFGGTTTILAGKIDLAGATGALTNAAGNSGSNGLVISGGTLLLSGSASNKLKDTATISLGGGTQTKMELSGSITEAAGALTLSSGAGTRVIDFGAGSGVLTLASIASATSGLSVQIWNWSGNAFSGNGTDRLIATGGFGSNTALSDITFYSGSGTGSLGTAMWVSGTAGELVPVPEPGALLAGLALLAPLAWRERRHWMRCAEARA